MTKPKTWGRFPAMTALAFIASLGAAILPASPVHAAVTPMVSAGTAHTIGLKSDGTVVAVGDNTSGQCNVSSWTDITQVSAGGGHSIGLKSGNTVIAVGNNDAGQCDISTWTGITQVSAGYAHTLGLKSDGIVVAVGNNGNHQCDVGSWTGIAQVDAGYYFHSAGRKSDGTAVAAGANSYGECNVGSWTGITQVSAGGAHTVGLNSGGTVVATGYNGYNQLNVGSWTGITQVSAGGNHTVGLKADGTVVAIGDNGNGQCNVSSWTNIIQVSAGAMHTVGLKSDGTVIATGNNEYNQCDVSGWNLGAQPSVTTEAATGIGVDFATINMSYTLGYYSSANVRFAYKESTDSTWIYTSWMPKWADGTHPETLTGLNSNTQYDFKAQLEYDSTEIQGGTLQFTTAKIPPTVTTDAAGGVGTNSAVLNMSYTLGDYSSIDVRFAYRKGADPWTCTAWVANPGSPYSLAVTGLASNTLYDFRAELKYNSTEIQGGTLQFTTGKITPTVTTVAAGGIGIDSATLNMSYTVGDYSTVDVRFAYKKTADLTWTCTSWVSHPGSPYSELVSGLDSNTQYDFRAELMYDSTEIQGSTLQFTTAKIPPTVTTDAATGVGTNSAILNMSYTLGDYSSVDVRFAYKKAADLTWAHTSWVTHSGSPYSELVPGLDSNTLYDFRAELKYDSTEVQGGTLQFTTGKITPTVTTVAAGGIGIDSATLNMSYTIGDHSPVSVRFAYKKSSDLTWTNTLWIEKSAPGTYAETLTGLAINTTYDFRAELKYDSSTINGGTLQFTTGVIPPVVTTGAASGVGIDSATLNGELTALGSAGTVDVSFCWGTSRGGPYPNTTPMRSMNGPASYRSNLSGLSLYTTYYFLAKADGGVHGVSYGVEKSFTAAVTLALPPPSHSSGTVSTVTPAIPVSLPNVTVQSASISASKVAPGDPIVVNATIANRGTVNGSMVIRLYINGQEEAIQGITLESGKTKSVTFTTVQNQSGTYTVYVGGVQAGSFTVAEYFDPDIILFISMTLIFFSFVLGIMYVWRRRQLSNSG